MDGDEDDVATNATEKRSHVGTQLCRQWYWLVLASVLVVIPVFGQLMASPSARPIVYVVLIEGVIDLGLAPFVDRILAEAEREQAAAVILAIDTFGGRVDAAVLIRDKLLYAMLHKQ
jgi:membrane-bound ClpP family serine protease